MKKQPKPVTIHGQKHDIFVLHGTPADRLPSILRDGLRPDASRRFDRKDVDELDDVVYVTQKPYIAQKFGGTHPMRGFLADLVEPDYIDGAIVKVAMTKEEFDKLEPDPQWLNPRKELAAMSRQPIDPAHIVAVAKHDNDGKHAPCSDCTPVGTWHGWQEVKRERKA